MRSILPTFVLVGALALPVATQAQTRTITGTVTVVGSGQPLTDATISIVGGTGRYAGARGVVTSTSRGRNSKFSDDTVTFMP